MTRGPRSTSLASYARAVEGLWSDCLKRPVLLSALDWNLITDWHARRVPLQVVREALEALAARRRATPPRGLGAIAEAVEESWAAITDGRVAAVPEPAGAPPRLPDPAQAWRACLAGPAADNEVGTLLRELLARHAAGASAADVDAALDTRLWDAAPEALRRNVERQVDDALAVFRGRMPAAAWQETRKRALTDRLRRHLGLGRVTVPQANPQAD